MERLAASAATEVVVEKQVVVETTRSSMTDADREKERELMDKSRDMIEYLRKEVTKLRRCVLLGLGLQGQGQGQSQGQGAHRPSPTAHRPPPTAHRPPPIAHRPSPTAC